MFHRQSKSGVLESVYAGELVPGDKLVQVDKGKVLEEPAEVLSVVEVEESGYWAPELQNVNLFTQMIFF